MLITSPSLKNGEYIPKKFTCDGGDINPEFQVQNVPEDAKSLVLIMDDPDAPSGTFTHWTVWNINPETIYIKEESKPPGSVEGINSAGQIGYIGPCPPAGNPHRYFSTLYALDIRLEVVQGASREVLEGVLRGHVIEKTELLGIYGRS